MNDPKEVALRLMDSCWQCQHFIPGGVPPLLYHQCTLKIDVKVGWYDRTCAEFVLTGLHRENPDNG